MGGGVHHTQLLKRFDTLATPPPCWGVKRVLTPLMRCMLISAGGYCSSLNWTTIVVCTVLRNIRFEYSATLLLLSQLPYESATDISQNGAHNYDSFLCKFVYSCRYANERYLIDVNPKTLYTPIRNPGNTLPSRFLAEFPMTCNVGLFGATENAGVENAIRSKTQAWKMHE